MAIPSAGAATTGETYDYGDKTFLIIGVRSDGTYVSKPIVTSGQMTAQEIRDAYESNADVNRYSDTAKAKLDGLPAASSIVTASNNANLKIRVLSQTEYDSLSSVDSNTLYFIR